MNDGVVSMGARVEVTKRLRRAYRGASKKEKGRVLDSFCESTGLSRSTAKRYLTSDVTGNPGVVRIDYRKARATKYSTVAKRTLQRVWVLSSHHRHGQKKQRVKSLLPRTWNNIYERLIKREPAISPSSQLSTLNSTLDSTLNC